MAIFRFWRHFLALETDFAAVSRYVEFTPDNFKTYSVEFVKLLLAIGSEVDVVAQDVCKALGKKCEKINEYRECISVRGAVFNDKVLMPKYNLTFQPWKEWHGDTNPPWWGFYNKVKHDRTSYFHEANLENCANALAGLFAMVLYCHKAENSQDSVEPTPALVHWYKDYKVPPGGPYILPYHVYRFVDTPFDKAKIKLE